MVRLEDYPPPMLRFAYTQAQSGPARPYRVVFVRCFTSVIVRRVI